MVSGKGWGLGIFSFLEIGESFWKLWNRGFFLLLGNWAKEFFSS
jgi:hypothetical protein